MKRAPSRTLALLLSGTLTLGGRALAMGPFEKNPPKVQEGLNAYSAGKYEDALKAFDEAKKDLKENPTLEFDRGNTLFKLNRLEEAREAYRHVVESEAGQLREKDYYNLGNAWAQLGNKKEAIAAYRRALTLDPSDEAARHNLEVVLQDLKPPQQPQNGDGGQDGGHKDGGQDGGQDGGHPRDGGTDGGQKSDGGQDGGQGDGGQKDGGQGDGGQKSDGGQGDGGQGDGGQGQGAPNAQGDGGSDGGTDGGAGQSTQPDKQDGGQSEAEEGLDDGGTAQSLNKADVQRLLDAMKQSEKNLQLWRFQQKKRPRKQNEKDW